MKEHVRAAAAVAGRGLASVLVGPDPAPAWRSRGTRRAALTLTLVGWALLLFGVTLLVTRSLGGGPGVPRAYPNGDMRLVLVLVAACLPLAVRFPLLAWRICYAVVLLGSLIPGQTRWDPGFVMILVVVFFVAGLRHPWPVATWMWALMLIPAWLWTGPDWVKAAEVTLVFTGVAVLAAGIAAWRRARLALVEQTERADRERARRLLAEERARIAREMHDVVAHHMSMIAVQAETAPYRLGEANVPEPVRGEFAALSGAAREALTEMRRLLGVLRGAEQPMHAPQPQITDVPGLVETARRAGARVALSMPSDVARMPPGVGVAAYRIVQEALSNAGRHAPGAAISVNVEVEPPVVRLKIVNEGGAAGQRREKGTGHGLAGMRERVAMLGGSLAVGPAPGGGFEVRAELPVNRAVA